MYVNVSCDRFWYAVYCRTSGSLYNYFSPANPNKDDVCKKTHPHRTHFHNSVAAQVSAASAATAATLPNANTVKTLIKG